MNSKVYVPFFSDHNVQAEHFSIFGVSNYNELLLLLGDKKIANEQEYLKLCNMYRTMVSGDILPTLEGYHPKIEEDFFQIPQDIIVKEIVEKKLYKNNEYLTKISNLDYKKIDELTIDHISFLFLEKWNDKYEKMNDIIGKLLDQIVTLQLYLPDEISKQKIVKSYIVHLMIFVPKCLSGLSLGRLEMYSEEEYIELCKNISHYQKNNNDFISQVLDNDMIVQEIDNYTKIKLLLELESYQHLMIKKYNHLIAYIINGGEVMMNQLPDLLMCMIQNEYVMDSLRGKNDLFS